MKLYFFESQCPALKDAEIVEKTLINTWLVVPTPLKNISWDDYSQYMEK